MATLCSTELRRLILGPASFEAIFNGGLIQVRSGAQPNSADDAPTGTVLATISAAGGLRFQRSGHYVTNDVAQNWLLDGSATGTAGWARLMAMPDGTGTAVPCIDFAIGPDNDEPGDFQMRLPTIEITPSTSIVVASWWFVLPPL